MKKTSPKPPPKTTTKKQIDYWGQAGREFLERHGLVAHRVPIRSRDFDYINSDPGGFLYYLARRLGLVPVFDQSQALSHGSWLHVALEGVGEGAAGMEARVQRKLQSRIAELKVAAETYGRSADSKIAETREDAMHALAWLRAALRYRNPNLPNLKDGLLTLLQGPQWKALGAEVTVLVKSPLSPVPLCAQFDRLYLNEKTNLVWFLDAKTCAGNTTKRCQLFPIESQPVHYDHILELALATPSFRETHGIPSKAKPGGAVHFTLNKPSIRLSGKDAPYCLYNSSKRSNLQAWAAPIAGGRWKITVKVFNPSDPVKTFTPEAVANSEPEAVKWIEETVGTKAERKATGEPSLARYEARCFDWYTATGDHVEEAERWAIAPPINVSTIDHATLSSGRFFRNYQSRLDLVSAKATQSPEPGSFPQWPKGAVDMRFEPNIYAPFYANSPESWPEIARENALVVFYPDGVLDP